MNITDLAQALGSNIWIYGGSLVLVLGILVFVHEWGHYIVARMCGVRVEIFSVGFGKEIWGFNDRHGTRWKISLIPLGGYVKLFGDTDPASAGHTNMVKEGQQPPRPMTKAELDVAFFTKPVWKRASVVFAGPAINYIFAVILLAGLYIWAGQPVVPPSSAAIVAGSNAEKYGFQPQDYIIAIDGKRIESFGDIRREVIIALDQERTFTIQRAGEIIELKAKAARQERTDRFGFKSSTGVLGLISAEEGIAASQISKIDGQSFPTPQDMIAELKKRMDTTFKIEIIHGKGTQSDVYIIHPMADKNTDLGTAAKPEEEILFLSALAPKQYRSHTLMTALQSAIKESYVMTRSSLEALGQMITGVRSATELGGVIRIGAIAGDMAQQGIIPLILLMALLSINLGFINLLPIPVLDGGHLVFYFLEALLGKPVPERIQEYAFQAGFIFLIGIMAFANLNDLWQLLTHS